MTTLFKFKYKKYYPNKTENNPISKYLIFFKGKNDKKIIDEDDANKFLNDVSNHFINFFHMQSSLSYYNNIKTVLNNEKTIYNDNSNSNDKFCEITKNRDELKRYFPRLILDADDTCTSLYFGMGDNPNKDSEYNWIPNIYRQNFTITTPFEKFILYLLQDIYAVLKIKGVPMLCGWGDISPGQGYRGDDISEIIESSGLPTIAL